MYTPPHNGPPSEDDVTRLLLATQAGDLVTVSDDGLTVSMIPFLYDASPPPRPSSLVLVHGPDGYVSPAWYVAKGEHGRVVPTWNYVLVAVHRTLRVHDDPEWTRDVVERLTRGPENGGAEPGRGEVEAEPEPERRRCRRRDRRPGWRVRR